MTGFVAATGKSYLCGDAANDPLYIEGAAGRAQLADGAAARTRTRSSARSTSRARTPTASARRTCSSPRSFAAKSPRPCTRSSCCRRRSTARPRSRSRRSAARSPCRWTTSWRRRRRCSTATSATTRRWPTSCGKSWPAPAPSSRASRRWARTWRPAGRPPARHRGQHPSPAQGPARPGRRQRRARPPVGPRAARPLGLRGRDGPRRPGSAHHGPAGHLRRHPRRHPPARPALATRSTASCARPSRRPASILMTAYGYDPSHTLVKARQDGLRFVLYKPFRVDQLLAALEGPGAGARQAAGSRAGRSRDSAIDRFATRPIAKRSIANAQSHIDRLES